MIKPRTLLFGLAIGTVTATPAAEVTVTITGLDPVAGEIRVGIYTDAASFPDSELAAGGATVPVTGSSAAVRLDVPPGERAVAVHHDIDGNGKLARNLVGYPTEPVAFSAGATLGMGAPDFADAAFTVPAGGTGITVAMPAE